MSFLTRLSGTSWKVLDRTYGSPLPFPSPLFSHRLLPFFLNDCGLCSLPPLRQWHQKTQTTTTKPLLLFFCASYKLFLNICGHDSSKSTSTQVHGPLSELISLWLSPPQWSLSSTDTKTPTGEGQAHTATAASDLVRQGFRFQNKFRPGSVSGSVG